MTVFDLMTADSYEQVVWCHDPATGLRAIVAIHSTRLGPALGGTRFFPYANEHDALVDVLRLAKGMTYKAAAAGLALGGGKAVILGDPRKIRTDELMLAYGRFVDALAGRYVTAEDVGTSQADMDLIRTVTRHVTGASSGSGDPSPATARGVVAAMRAVSEHLWHRDDLSSRHIVVSGVGKVGSALVRLLADTGAKLTLADVDEDRVRAVAAAHGADVVPVERAHAIECDIFSPCALGAVLSEVTIPELRGAAVCGSANNQLATAADAQRLTDRGVLYAPDYVVNAGGLINIFEELGQYDPDRALARVDAIRETTLQVLRAADADGIPTAVAADRLAEQRLAAVGRHEIRRFDETSPQPQPSARSDR